MSESATRCNRTELLDTLVDCLHIEDFSAIDVVYATAISNFLPGDPVWLFLIGPPGGTKTELLRAFQGESFFSLSKLTPQTLISGLNTEREVDLLPKLDGKTLVIKDFTSILAMDSKVQAEIFADLRDAYDGYLSKAFGSGVGKKGYKARFSLIAGVTPAIDMYRVVHGVLGERFLKVRLHTDGDKAIDKAAAMLGKEEVVRERLIDVATRCIEYYGLRARCFEPPTATDEVLGQIKSLGNITAKLRSEVARDRHHTVMYFPEAEIGTRLTKQFLKLARALAIFHDRESITEDELVPLSAVARDCIPRQRLELVRALTASEDFRPTKVIGDGSNIPTATAKEGLEELWMLKLLDRTGDNSFEWKLDAGTRALMARSRILDTQNMMCVSMNQVERASTPPVLRVSSVVE